MNKYLKLFLQAILIGIITMTIGAGIIRLMKPEQELKPLLGSLFITGFILFMSIEAVGGHKEFCKKYNSV